MDVTLRHDQGQEYRGHLRKVLPHIEDAYRKSDDGFRSHLGASILGGDCDRALWYTWRWFTRSAFNGQMLRLFNRGHLEEGRFIALLLTLGVQIYQQDEQGQQYRISHANGHIGGSGDGVLVGVPDLGPTPCLAEFKTHGEKSFKQLAGDNWRYFLEYTFGESKMPEVFEGEGVQLAKFEHYIQMQLYMYKMGLTVALYVAVNKNSDAIYAELVPLHAATAEQFLGRGENIIASDHAPPRINNSPGFWKCKFCDHKPVCHLNAAPERNCRTCVSSIPLLMGTKGQDWFCNARGIELDKSLQATGCSQYTAR